MYRKNHRFNCSSITSVDINITIKLWNLQNPQQQHKHHTEIKFAFCNLIELYLDTERLKIILAPDRDSPFVLRVLTNRIFDQKICFNIVVYAAHSALTTERSMHYSKIGVQLKNIFLFELTTKPIPTTSYSSKSWTHAWVCWMLFHNTTIQR